MKDAQWRSFVRSIYRADRASNTWRSDAETLIRELGDDQLSHNPAYNTCHAVVVTYGNETNEYRIQPRWEEYYESDDSENDSDNDNDSEPAAFVLQFRVMRGRMVAHFETVEQTLKHVEEKLKEDANVESLDSGKMAVSIRHILHQYASTAPTAS